MKSLTGRYHTVKADLDDQSKATINHILIVEQCLINASLEMWYDVLDDVLSSGVERVIR